MTPERAAAILREMAASPEVCTRVLRWAEDEGIIARKLNLTNYDLLDPVTRATIAKLAAAIGDTDGTG